MLRDGRHRLRPPPPLIPPPPWNPPPPPPPLKPPPPPPPRGTPPPPPGRPPPLAPMRLAAPRLPNACAPAPKLTPPNAEFGGLTFGRGRAAGLEGPGRLAAGRRSDCGSLVAGLLAIAPPAPGFEGRLSPVRSPSGTDGRPAPPPAPGRSPPRPGRFPPMPGWLPRPGL